MKFAVVFSAVSTFAFSAVFASDVFHGDCWQTHFACVPDRTLQGSLIHCIGVASGVPAFVFCCYNSFKMLMYYDTGCDEKDEQLEDDISEVKDEIEMIRKHSKEEVATLMAEFMKLQTNTFNNHFNSVDEVAQLLHEDVGQAMKQVSNDVGEIQRILIKYKYDPYILAIVAADTESKGKKMAELKKIMSDASSSATLCINDKTAGSRVIGTRGILEPIMDVLEEKDDEEDVGETTDRVEEGRCFGWEQHPEGENTAPLLGQGGKPKPVVLWLCWIQLLPLTSFVHKSLVLGVIISGVYAFGYTYSVVKIASWVRVYDNPTCQIDTERAWLVWALLEKTIAVICLWLYMGCAIKCLCNRGKLDRGVRLNEHLAKMEILKHTIKRCRKIVKPGTGSDLLVCVNQRSMEVIEVWNAWAPRMRKAVNEHRRKRTAATEGHILELTQELSRQLQATDGKLGSAEEWLNMSKKRRLAVGQQITYMRQQASQQAISV